MSTTAPLAAEILESSALGFAAAANALLQQRRPEGQENDARAWQEYLRQRILELAAAVRLGEPSLFTSRVAWLRRAAAARSGGDAGIVLALESLQQALAVELPAAVAGDAGRIVAAALTEARRPVETEATHPDPATPTGRLALDYIAACLDPAGQDPLALIMRAIDRGLSPADAYCQVLLPAQKEVGNLWHTGDFSVSEEHIVSETTRRAMTLIAARAAPRTPTGPTMLAASVAGNAHDLGLRVAADLFALDGWRCIFLGANVPTAEIGPAVREYAVHLAVLTATLTPQLNALASAIDGIRQHSPATKILVGGVAFEDAPELWRKTGADGYSARVDEVVAAGRRLVAAGRSGG